MLTVPSGPITLGLLCAQITDLAQESHLASNPFLPVEYTQSLDTLFLRRGRGTLRTFECVYHSGRFRAGSEPFRPFTFGKNYFSGRCPKNQFFSEVQWASFRPLHFSEGLNPGGLNP